MFSLVVPLSAWFSCGRNKQPVWDSHNDAAQSSDLFQLLAWLAGIANPAARVVRHSWHPAKIGIFARRSPELRAQFWILCFCEARPGPWLGRPLLSWRDRLPDSGSDRRLGFALPMDRQRGRCDL